jgi:hypothetical protein
MRTRIFYYPDCGGYQQKEAPLFVKFSEAVEWTRQEARKVYTNLRSLNDEAILFSVNRWELPARFAPSGPTNWHVPARGFWVEVVTLQEGFAPGAESWE